MTNVPKKFVDAAVAIEVPNRFPYPPIPWPYAASEFCAWPIPAPAAELRSREGAMLSSAKSSNFCFVLSGPALVAISGKKIRSEEHTSELQSHSDLVCRLLLEKKKKKTNTKKQ